jgi:hypothetical protein
MLSYNIRTYENLFGYQRLYVLDIQRHVLDVSGQPDLEISFPLILRMLIQPVCEAVGFLVKLPDCRGQLSQGVSTLGIPTVYPCLYAPLTARFSPVNKANRK